MVPERLDTPSLWVPLVLSTAIATLSFLAGLSTWVAAVAGTATAALGWWAVASEP